jgi:hypothetical protein
MPRSTHNPYRRHGRPQLRAIDGGAPTDARAGRHALDEDALLTPIFAALARRSGRHPSPPDPVERFRRDPLTAPLPVVVPVVVPARRSPGAHARVEPLPEQPAQGRHALHRAPAWIAH